MNIREFDYYLPQELIAQFPSERRDESRLLCIDRSSKTIRHGCFKTVIDELNAGDALVLNDTKVRPVRLIGRIGTRQVDVLLVERLAKNSYLVKAKPGAKFKPGTEVVFSPSRITARCVEDDAARRKGMKLLEFQMEEDIETLLDSVGLMPLPPYIKRAVKESDAARYQTVYAKNSGAIAAPTAGLHFTQEILDSLWQKGVALIYLTLHIGLGTFTPVRAENIKEHKMHAESCELPQDAAREIERIRRSGGRICAVGTTVCRVLESCAYIENSELRFKHGKGTTDIFIYPGYEFKAVDMLLTNFHLPKTTLLMLVYAFAGREIAREAYAEAVKEKYRFFSYGDCMLIA
ncbi:MAG: tRNA preQ1(34) S-adenosylmethionine ribosyltransferase-isomerase QueA [Candidatus Omnitrophica bacterium]|nr:tRNA preQ1(34) S-adenosylmethionine ribosyltransferase-isomerase QueA [Candidatus Omnitrophota bacterium]MBU4478239.1 tRNA preQ1(34) S-adenosylmethionine ribosyltransferase-isomerase QueA [Candidatus Omnitrophota bacterium]MCG2703307.1 tRNA preQ1(34) S-adenosylmethionine ribosyltransferase-isomerase QueA [Candidatus Omnitrophota bacterium]